jgi:hypothetical protein
MKPNNKLQAFSHWRLEFKLKPVNVN